MPNSKCSLNLGRLRKKIIFDELYEKDKKNVRIIRQRFVLIFFFASKLEF